MLPADLKKLSGKETKNGGLAAIVKGLATLTAAGSLLVFTALHSAETQRNTLINQIRNSPKLSCQYSGEVFENYARAEDLYYDDAIDYMDEMRKENNLGENGVPKEGDYITVFDYNRDGKSFNDNCSPK